jgi:Antitoxin SocA-like, Panacea domain
MKIAQSNSLRTTRAAGVTKSVRQQMLDEMGIRHRIVYPFSPKKTIASLHVLAELMSSPNRVEHPLLRLKGVMAALWIADVRHFQAYGRPVTGSRWQAYPQGPIAGDVLSLLKADPIWLAELPETDYALPFEVGANCITRNLRVRFGYDPKEFLKQSERDALKKAVATAKRLKHGKREEALRGKAYQLTPLYGDIPWEFLLPPKKRTRAVIDDLVTSARNTVL